MKDLGEAKMILGMEIDRDRKLRKLFLTQKQYLRRVLKRFRFDKQTKRVSTPLASQFKISAAMSLKNDAERAYMENVPYANVVGSLMYAMICTRPDISHAVGMVSSQSAIHLAKNQVYHSRTKHIDVQYHFIREILEEGGVRIKKVHTSKNPMDMLTKTPPKMVDGEIEEWIFAKVEICKNNVAHVHLIRFFIQVAISTCLY
ncbi:hypothetical protein Tco_0863351 [Tanacetum coccineum]